MSVIEMTRNDELCFPMFVTPGKDPESSRIYNNSTTGFRTIPACFHPHLGLPPSRGKKSKEVGLLLWRD